VPAANSTAAAIAAAVPRFTARQQQQQQQQQASAPAPTADHNQREGKQALPAPARPHTNVPSSMFDPSVADTHGLFSGCNLVGASGGHTQQFVDQSSAILPQPQLVKVQQNAQKGELTRTFGQAIDHHYKLSARANGFVDPKQLRAQHNPTLSAMISLLNRPTQQMRIIEEYDGAPVQSVYNWGLTTETANKGTTGTTKLVYVNNPYDKRS